MKSAGIPELAALLHLCSAVTLIVFFIFSLSPSTSTDNGFMGSNFELIMKAKSSPVFVFFFCNLIVITILLENSTSSYQDFDWFGFLCSREEEDSEEVNIMDNMEVNNHNNDNDDNDDDDEDEDEDEDFHGYDGYDEDNDDDIEDDDLDSEDEEGDDDLKKRIEEFIAKINEAWKAERLMERQLQ